MPNELCPDNPRAPGAHNWVHSARTGRRWCKACGEPAPEVIRVLSRAQLQEVAEMLGVGDWHEPDERDVTAEVFGTSFDNAGFWPFDPAVPADRITGNLDSEGLEMYVNLYQNELLVAQVNLATLFAMACVTVD